MSVEALLATARDAYATPGRHYHTWSHALDVVARWCEVHADGGWHHPAETWLAAVFHDAVYVPGRPDNELRSAELAVEAIGATLGEPIDAERVGHLIRLTASHGQHQQVTAEEALFLDCDMAILGAPPEVFAAYEQRVAVEYAPVVQPHAWREGRRRFVQGLLSRERIFLSDRFHDALEARARANLARALDG